MCINLIIHTHNNQLKWDRLSAALQTCPLAVALGLQERLSKNIPDRGNTILQISI